MKHILHSNDIKRITCFKILSRLPKIKIKKILPFCYFFIFGLTLKFLIMDAIFAFLTMASTIAFLSVSNNCLLCTI